MKSALACPHMFLKREKNRDLLALVNYDRSSTLFFLAHTLIESMHKHTIAMFHICGKCKNYKLQMHEMNSHTRMNVPGCCDVVIVVVGNAHTFF